MDYCTKNHNNTKANTCIESTQNTGVIQLLSKDLDREKTIWNILWTVQKVDEEQEKNKKFNESG